MDEKTKKQDVKDEHKNEEKKDTRLTTASLASGGKPTDSKKEIELPPHEMTSAKVERDLPIAKTKTPSDAEEQSVSLLSPEEVKDFRARWDAIQVSFVDDPRQSVGKADELVAMVMKRLAEVFAKQREILENQWSRGGDVSTEDLRLSLRRYRSFFSRLLSI